MFKTLRLKILHLHHYNVVHMETFISFTLLVIICGVQSASAVTRFENRSLYINNATPGAVSSYTITMNYNTLTSIGSIDMLFCNDPIPTDPCNAPAGLNVSGAALSSQTGETGFSVVPRSANELVLSRPPQVVGTDTSSYTLSNIINSTDTSQSFSIRLSDYASSDASGPLIDLGSVISQITEPITLESQVPPMLIFCLAQQVAQNCSQGSGGNYDDMGDLTPSDTLTASSQMAAGTNASSGYAITVNGPTMSAGSNGITPLNNPTPSIPGKNQFGINLVANDSPTVGSDPDGDSTNTILGSDYGTPDKFAYNNGDVVASAPNVSLVRRYTVSYIVNSAPSLAAGVYTTTLTFICSGRF
jgi:hypothetical protein